jgi:hypothetical protein
MYIPNLGGNQMTELSKADAIALTKKAHLHFDVFYSTLLQIHRGNGHKLLGYGNWADYMKAEFDVGTSEAYRKLREATLKEQIPAGDDVKKKHLRQLISFPEDYRLPIWAFSKSYSEREQIELTGSVVKACGERFVELVTTGGTSVNGESLAMDAALTEELYEVQQRQKSHMKEREYIVRGYQLEYGQLWDVLQDAPDTKYLYGQKVRITVWIDDEAKS